MKNSNFKKLCKKITPTKMARFFNVERTYIHRLMNRGYAPPEWFYNLVQLSNGEYTHDDFQQDVISFKANSIPMVDAKQVENFLSDCPDDGQSVRKHRQAAS
tara:strand:- start:63 stop:368 length:306 start_codon:yes stop_codon:yes gene_type:complete